MLLLGVLSRAIQSNPERDWLQPLIDQEIFSEPPMTGSHPDFEKGLKLLHSWALEAGGRLSDERLTDLKTDNTRLFVGVGKPIAPPWESVYFNEDRMIFQKQTLQVRAWYRRFDLEPEKLHKEPDDHIGLELSFLAHLAKLGVGALEARDESGLEQALESQRGFLAEHPLQWAAVWSDRVEKGARTDFYRGLAILIRGTLFSLADRLGVQLPEVKAA
jgi:TorA maturation chaperone TorD